MLENSIGPWGKMRSMQTAEQLHVGRRPINLGRLFWVGPLAVAAAIVAVLLVRLIAFAVWTFPADFQPLRWEALTVFTAFFVTLAVIVFAVVARRASNPDRTYRRIAFVALVASLIPDLLLPLNAARPAPWSGVIVLMVTHVAAWWPTVEILTKLGLSDRSTA